MKKLISGKNFMTILALATLIGILIIFYSRRVNDAINPTTVPYAKKQIASGTPITNAMVGTMQVPPSMLTEDTIKNMSEVVGKYSNADTIIPKGSLFYHRNVVEKEELPQNIILDYPEGYVLFNLPVSTASTYGNSIYPGNYIDIYMKARAVDLEGTTKGNKKVIFGKFVENVEVIAVKDSSGQPVFQDLEEGRTPAMIIFAVPEDTYVLLKKIEYLRTFESALIPVPTNESLKNEPGAQKLSNKQLEDWVNKVTVWDKE
ncbi:MAG: hypothetical protein IJ193_06850 [Bacilli bacterium]|nr:hypothetical protein [Bacilli bacterium]